MDYRQVIGLQERCEASPGTVDVAHRLDRESGEIGRSVAANGCK